MRAPALPPGSVIWSSARSWMISEVPPLSEEAVGLLRPAGHPASRSWCRPSRSVPRVMLGRSPAWCPRGFRVPCCLWSGLKWGPAEAKSGASHLLNSWMWNPCVPPAVPGCAPAGARRASVAGYPRTRQLVLGVEELDRHRGGREAEAAERQPSAAAKARKADRRTMIADSTSCGVGMRPGFPGQPKIHRGGGFVQSDAGRSAHAHVVRRRGYLPIIS